MFVYGGEDKQGPCKLWESSLAFINEKPTKFIQACVRKFMNKFIQTSSN